jgi:hypothetical protein
MTGALKAIAAVPVESCAETADEATTGFAKFGLLNDGVSREFTQVGFGLSVNAVVRAGIGYGVLRDRMRTRD